VTPTLPPFGARTVRLSDVEPEHVSWLWPGYLPRGKLVILDGDPGVAKSTLCLELAARVSTGAPMPDGSGGGRPADVLLLSAEDGLADTIVPRLDAAGADRSRVHALTEVAELQDDGRPTKRPASLPADLPEVERIVAEHQVALVVVDVLMAFLGGGVDSHRDQDVRRVLHQLAAIADRNGCTIILIRHLNKAAGSQAMYRGGGSIGIIGAARAAFLVAYDPDDETGARRVLAPVKMNLAPMPPALAYVLVEDPVLKVAAIDWTGASAHRAGDLLRDRGSDDERAERDEAVDWLMTYLADSGGEAKAADVLRAAGGMGYGRTTMHRARRRAGVDSRKGGFGGGWVWSYPSEGFTKVPKVPGSQAPEPSEPSGNLRSLRGCTGCGQPMQADYVAAGLTRHPYCLQETS
jgi:hypothetical protein